MQNVNGTTYHLETPAEVIRILEDSRLSGARLRKMGIFTPGVGDNWHGGA